VQIGDEVEVMVLDIDEERRRISLGIKQCKANPWDEFAKNHEKGEKVSGNIKSITDFGIFIGLPKAASTAWFTCPTSPGTKPAKKLCASYKKGDAVEAVILAVDPEARAHFPRHQATGADPFGDFTGSHDKGVIVKGKVKTVDAKGATIEVAGRC
jgi:small subunit ribosomal protein S1